MKRKQLSGSALPNGPAGPCAAPLPADEAKRLAVLRRYAILDTPAEDCFDRITRCAARLFQVPVALISLLDEGRQWFKSRCGLDIEQTDRDLAFCGHAILQDGILVVPDATDDPRFRGNRLVTDGPRIRFYAGVPLINPDGFALGTLCLIDTRPRPELTVEALAPLRDLAAMVVDQLEIRLAAGDALADVEARASERRRFEATERQLRLFIEFAPAAIAMFDADMRYLAASRRWITDYRLTDRNIIGLSHYDVFPEIPDRWKADHARALAGEVLSCEEDPFDRADGTTDWVRWELRPWRNAGGTIGGIIMFTELVTEKKRALIDLEESRQFLNAVLENIQDGIVVCDAEGRLNLFNRATRELHGLPEKPVRPEALAEHYDLYLADGTTRMTPADIPLLRALNGERVRDVEMVVAPKTGTPRRLLASGQAMFAQDGRKLGAVVSMHDITERARAVRRLAESERRYRDLYNNTPVMLHSIDKEGRLISVSDYWLDQLGYSRDEVIGRKSTDFLTEESRRYATDVVLPAFMRSGSCRDVEYQFIRKNGAVLDLLVSAITEHAADGSVERSLAVLTDVTRRKQAERALVQSEQRFRGAFQTATHGIALVAPDGRWLAVNDALCRMVGYSDAELLRIDFQTITHPDDLDADLDHVRQVLAGEVRSYQMEKRYIHKDGQTIWILQSVSLVRAPDGSPIHFVSQIVDLTERRRAEEQLRQAQKLEAVGQLTGGLAHDFNNLLAAVMGNLQLVERSLGDDEKSKRRVRAALDATRRGADLTRRLLAFSRRQALEPKTLDVNELVIGMDKLLSRTLGEAVELQTRCVDDVWLCTADPSQLESAVLNLAINARDAMPDGGKLTIETANASLDRDYTARHDEVTPGDYVLVAVSDTGVGIPEPLLDRVLQPFFTTKPPGKGTGLGLSMVFGFVKQTGGHMKIYSEESYGTTVKMYLPRDCVSAASPIRTQVEEVAPVGGHETILVVEDDPAVRQTAVDLLADLGYRVLTAENAPAALRLLDAHDDISLLFSDVVMPGGMNGLDLAARVRLEHPDLRILHTTGYAEFAASRNGHAQLSGDLISKPYRREDLARKIREVLDAR